MEEESRTDGAPPSPSVIRFGPYELDLSSAELRKGHLRIRLQDQPFQILVALLEQPGKIVLREEIRQKLWRSNTVVEFDHSINAAVKRLRDVLRDSADKPRYIETVARRGYRFIGEINTPPSVSPNSQADRLVTGVALPASFREDGFRSVPSECLPLITRDSLMPEPLEPAVKSLGKCDLASEHNRSAESRGTPATVAQTSAVYKGRKREVLSLALAGTCLLASIITVVAYWRLTRIPKSAIIAEIMPPDGVRFDLRIGGPPLPSPDGRTLAFTAVDKSRNSMLWIRPLNSPSLSHPLSGTEGARDPFWSADSRALGFFSDGQLKTVGLSGGPALAVAAVLQSGGASWNRDGNILFVPAFGKGVYKVASAGGNTTLVVAPNLSIFTYYALPRFLPDGKHFLYLAGGGDPAAAGTYFASLDGKERRLVLRGETGAIYASDHLLYLRDGSLMAQTFDPERGELKEDPFTIAEQVATAGCVGLFGVSENGTLIYQARGAVIEKQLTWFDRTGTKLGVTGQTADYWDLRLSPDGHKLAINAGFPAGSSNSHIWVDELERAVRRQLTIRPETGPGVPVWSPDGQTIAFGASAKAASGIYRKPSNGGGTEELLLSDSSGSEIWPTSWSRDGKFMLYGRGPKRSLPIDIWLLPLDRERKPSLFVRTQASDGQFSPDCRWVAYASKESGREEVYVVPFDGANGVESSSHGLTGRSQVSAGGGRCPRWRRDGKEIFYLSPAGEMMVAVVEAKGTGLEVRTRQLLFRSPLEAPTFTPYDVTSDGKKFVINVLVQQNVPLTMMVNWTANLKKH
jgi:DNA-binding winged helix-turn-helix (wHTH) protein/Tol biopolymer transport system component